MVPVAAANCKRSPPGNFEASQINKFFHLTITLQLIPALSYTTSQQRLPKHYRNPNSFKMHPQSQQPRNVIVPLCKLLVAYFLFCVVEFQFWPSLSENLPYPVLIRFIAEICVGLVWHVLVKRISAAVVWGWSSGTVVYSSEVNSIDNHNPSGQD